MSTQPPIRIGLGFDAHRLVPGRPLVLGGLTVPYGLGLLGHSDADVIAHALCDALLGAAGFRDIGHHFPDDDPRYAGISSLKLLADVTARLAAEGWVLGNADVTLVAQAPKVAPYLPEMQRNLAEACTVSPAQVNVKATTTEGLGFTGTGEGMAAYAVALITRT